MTGPDRVRVVSEPLGGSALALAVQEQRLPPALQQTRLSSASEWRAYADSVRATAAEGWYDAIAPSITPSGAARDRIERVAGGQGVVVTTGQQAALFGGPLYTLTKALSALALADVIEQSTGIPTAPVFWAATDDADFIEAATTYVADGRGLHELSIAARPPAGTTMAALPLDGMAALVEGLRSVSGSAAHAEYFEAARDAFRDGATLGGAYVQLLRALLEPLGIAVMDSSHPAYRQAARPILMDALRRADDVAGAVAECSAALRAAGYRPQVEDDRGLSLVFTVQDGLKQRVAVGDAHSVAAAGKDVALAPNVLLRPIVERTLLPTVSYVAGPGELAYLAQSNAVARVLGCAPVRGSPRWSCTVIEAFASRALERLGVEYHELNDLHQLEARIARGALPPAFEKAMAALRTGTSDAIDQLRSANEADALVDATVLDGLARSLEHRVDRAERRIIAAVKRRDTQTRQDLEVARAAFFPKGKRQERVLNFVPMLARGGAELLERMQELARRHAESLVGQESRTVAAR